VSDNISCTDITNQQPVYPVNKEPSGKRQTIGGQTDRHTSCNKVDKKSSK